MDVLNVEVDAEIHADPPPHLVDDAELKRSTPCDWRIADLELPEDDAFHIEMQRSLLPPLRTLYSDDVFQADVTPDDVFQVDVAWQDAAHEQGQDEGREKGSCDARHPNIKPPDNKHAGVLSDDSSNRAAASATLKPGTTASAQSLRRSKRTASKSLSDDSLYSRSDLSIGGSRTAAPLPRVTGGKSQGLLSSPFKPTPWRCLECNIFFDNAQALGGHRTNSRDHKRRVNAVLAGDTSSLPTMPRSSSEVYSFEETPASTQKKRKAPAMAQLDCFENLLEGFEPEVQAIVAGRKSPAAFFASCNLEVFKRHSIFGSFAEYVINEYFHGPCHALEEFVDNTRAVWQWVEEHQGLARTDQKEKELLIFRRMLITKKRFLDINRRAVSKRLKKMRDKDVKGKKFSVRVRT